MHVAICVNLEELGEAEALDFKSYSSGKLASKRRQRGNFVKIYSKQITLNLSKIGHSFIFFLFISRRTELHVAHHRILFSSGVLEYNKRSLSDDVLFTFFDISDKLSVL